MGKFDSCSSLTLHVLNRNNLAMHGEMIHSNLFLVRQSMSSPLEMHVLGVDVIELALTQLTAILHNFAVFRLQRLDILSTNYFNLLANRTKPSHIKFMFRTLSPNLSQALTQNLRANRRLTKFSFVPRSDQIQSHIKGCKLEEVVLIVDRKCLKMLIS